MYEDANRRIQVTSAAGLTLVSSFDTVGRLVSASASDGAARETKYFYDAQGRLAMTQDAQGARSFNFYDAAGRLAFQVNAAGEVTQFTYNNVGQLLSQTQYAARIASTAGWVDNATNPTRVTKTSLVVGVDVISTPGEDRTSTYDYDDAGRLDTRTDAAGTETTLSYDGASRLTQEQTGERVTRYFYDADGNPVGVVDALGYLTESKYDAAGNLLETVRYTTRGANAGNVAGPLWIGITNPTAVAGRAFSYRMPAIDADGDTPSDTNGDGVGDALTYAFVGSAPAWLSLDTSGAGGVTLRGTAPTALTSHTVTVSASDGRGRSTNVTLTITVANTAPTWAALPNVSVPVNTSGYTLVLPVVSDNESAAGQLTYSFTGLPPGLSATANTISGVPSVPGTYMVTARVSDTDGTGLTTERRFALTVSNAGPRIAPIDDTSVFVNTAFELPLTAIDPEGQTLTYSALTPLPAGVTLTSTASGAKLTGTLTSLAAHAVEIEARDPNGRAAPPLSFVLNVVNRAPQWATFNSPNPKLAGVAYSFTPPAAVDPDGRAITYSAVGLPAGLAINAATGVISGTPPASAVGMYSVTLTASDPDGGSVERFMLIRLTNAVPVHSGWRPDPLDVEFQSDDVSHTFFPIQVPPDAFTDANGNGDLSFAASIPAEASFWFHFDPVQRQFFGHIPARQDTDKSYVITLRATDSQGAQASVSFTIQLKKWEQGGQPLSVPGAGALSSPSKPLELAPSGGALAQAAIAPLTDVLVGWRPVSLEALRSFAYYDAAGRQVGQVDERGFLSETVFDEQSNTQSTLTYLTAVTVSASDTLATLKARAGVAQTRTVSFDDRGRVLTSTGVDGTLTRNEYDAAGRVVRQVTRAGQSDERASRTRYNAFGEVIGTLGGEGDAALLAAHPTPTDADIQTAIASRGTRYEYDSLGRTTKSIDASGNITLFYYDVEGRLTHTVDARGDVSETVYTAFGEVKETRRYGTRVRNTALAPLLDELKAGTKGLAELKAEIETFPSGIHRIESYQYDPRGLLKKTVDGEGFETKNEYSAFGELSKQIRTILKAAGGGAAEVTTSTQFDYDLVGQLIAQTGDVGGINFNTQTQYDAYGRVIGTIDAAGKLTRTTYNDSGRTIEVRFDPSGLNRAMTTQYDAYGRVLEVRDALGQRTTYAYNDVTRTLSVTTPEGVTTETVRTRYGETASVTVRGSDGRGGTLSNTTSYTYNRDGQLLTVTDALGNVVSESEYEASGSGRLHQTKDARGVVTLFELYDELNRVKVQRLDPSGLDLTTVYDYNEFGEIGRVLEAKGSQPEIGTLQTVRPGGPAGDGAGRSGRLEAADEVRV